MRIVIAAIGRGGADPGQALYAHYARRVAFPMDLKEITVKRPLRGAELMRAEADALLAAVPDRAVLVALDAAGKTLDSRAFATKLGEWRDGGVGDVAFVVGGADGLDKSLKDRADLILSLGAMTWPHLLVRGMLAEQIYRAQCILGNHPYHRG